MSKALLSLNAITCFITYVLDLWTLGPCESDSVLKLLKGKQSPLTDAVVSCENTVRHVLLQIRTWRKRRVEVLSTLLRLCLTLLAPGVKLSFRCKFKYHLAIMYFCERLSLYFTTWWPSCAAAKRPFYSRRESGVNKNTQPLLVTSCHHLYPEIYSHPEPVAVNLMSWCVLCCHWPTFQQIMDLFFFQWLTAPFSSFFRKRGIEVVQVSLHIFFVLQPKNRFPGGSDRSVLTHQLSNLDLNQCFI